MLFDIRIQSAFSLFHFIDRNQTDSGMNKSSLFTGETMNQANYSANRMGTVALGADITMAEPGLSETVTTAVSLHEIYLRVLFTVWMIGIAVLITYGIVSYVKLKRTVSKAVRLCENIYECDSIATPFVFGIFHPGIYIPFHMTEEEQRYVLAHERYHIRRYDYLVKLLGFMLLTIYWMNPFVWLSYFCFVRDQEMSCDESVLLMFGNEIKQAYSMSLLNYAIGKNRYMLTPLAFGESDVKKRIKNILRFRRPQVWMPVIGIFVVIVIILTCLTSGRDTNTAIDDNIPKVISVSESEDQEMTNQEILLVVEKWAEAFSSKDGSTIVELSSKEVQSSLEKRDLLTIGEDSIAFGYAGPEFIWSENGKGYTITINYEYHTADIFYYGWNSDPHVSIWHEKIGYHFAHNKFTVTSEELLVYDSIDLGNDFDKAYSNGINGTLMDYTCNGLGETLNRNALLSSSYYYRELFDPVSSLRVLLNLTDDDNKVRIEIIQDDSPVGVCNVKIDFTEDSIEKMISMIQPWGEEGIWIPQDYGIKDTSWDYPLGDIDGNGEDEYLQVSELEGDNQYTGHLEFFFNGNMIYEYNDLLRIDGGEAYYIDLDQDGKEEIFFTFYPYVNSMPLTEYAVLKNTGDTWKALEIMHGETSELDNSFPITCVYGNQKNLIHISCQGYDDVLNGIHYETGMKYTEGEKFGNILPWGIWDITVDNYEGKACLVASHGLGGLQEKYDYLGRVNIYFNYDNNGKIQILNMVFMAEGDQ